MALARSASGPGGLSINTSSANMFGSTNNSQPPAPGGLFGSASQTNSQPANSSTPKLGGLFGNTSSGTSSQPQQSGSSLFGASASTPQPQQSGTGLFGGASTTTPQSQPQQTGGLFGNASQTQSQSQPAQGSGLFGASAQNQSQQPQNQNTTGGLFGSGTPSQTAATGTGTGTSGGLFGSLANSSQPSSNTTGAGGMFGQSAQQKPSLFGGLNQQQQQPQNQSNSLGQSQQQTSMGFGGSLGIGLTMGQSAAQQTVPGVRIDVSNLKGTTRFNDLQEDLQKQIEQIDEFIQKQMSYKRDVDALMPAHGDMLESIPNDVKFVARKYEGAHSALESAAQAIESARVLVNQDAHHARLSFRAIDNLKLPQQYHTSGIWSSRQQPAGTANTETDGQDLVGFFSKTADEMEDQMKRYEKNLTDIEMHMHGVSDGLVEQLQRMMATKNGATAGPDEKIQELGIVLKDFEQGILKVASDVGSAREGMTRLQIGDFMGSDGDRNGVY